MQRRFSGYSAVSHEQLSVRGAAPKFILRSNSNERDWYIVKAAESWGEIETLTELLNNMIGERLGFPMAHHGLLRADGYLRFASRNFQSEEETLIHGSVLFREVFDDDLNGVGKKVWDEQRTFDISLIRDVLEQVCGAKHDVLFSRLVEMLIFDALIGSMDRHMQNWGVLASIREPRSYCFAPIFDSARALLWDCDEDKLKRLAENNHALDGYLNRAKPKIGMAALGRVVNHFSLVKHLMQEFPVPTREALRKLDPISIHISAGIVREFPFSRAFSSLRKALVAKVLVLRAEKLTQILEEGGK